MFRSTLALIRKEFLQVFRDSNMMRLIFIMPIIQLLLLGHTVNIDVENIDLAVYDHDRSDESRDFVQSFKPGEYFNVGSSRYHLLKAETGIKRGKYTAYMVIPPEFGRRIEHLKPVDVGLIIDGTNANSASITLGYSGLITNQYNLREAGFEPPLTVRQKMLYNPEVESVNFMVPGIVAVLLTMITMMLTSMAIVREREIGTLEQLMVTPISTTSMIMGKTIPFAILGFVEMSVALVFGIAWFGIPFEGSWLLLYSLSFIFLFTTLGLGMFISTISSTQQQAMFFAWFFSIFAILTSGFFTPISNMPESVQILTYLNPLRYFLYIVRGIMMKGSSADILYPQILAMIAFGVVIFSFAWMRFSKRVK
jgi:ABC-2 type transport system permease protein